MNVRVAGGKTGQMLHSVDLTRERLLQFRSPHEQDSLGRKVTRCFERSADLFHQTVEDARFRKWLYLNDHGLPWTNENVVKRIVSERW